MSNPYRISGDPIKEDVEYNNYWLKTQEIVPVKNENELGKAISSTLTALKHYSIVLQHNYDPIVIGINPKLAGLLFKEAYLEARVSTFSSKEILLFGIPIRIAPDIEDNIYIVGQGDGFLSLYKAHIKDMNCKPSLICKEQLPEWLRV